MKRNVAIDIMKAIGIMSVIVGHLRTPAIISTFVYSYHMPLFFLIGGYFFRPKPNIAEAAAKDFKRLVIPYLFTGLVLSGAYAAKTLLGLEKDFHNTFFFLKGIFWGCGSAGQTAMIKGNLTYIGPVWFLVSLFWCKLFYNLLACHTRRPQLYAAVIAIVATLVHYYVIFIPLGITTGASAMMFYLIGHWVREHAVSKYAVVVGVVCWLVGIACSWVIMARCCYGLYPVDVVGACGATAIIYVLSKGLSKTWACPALAWIGVNTLVFLCFHAMDMSFGITQHLPLSGYYGIKFVYMLAFCSLMTWLCYRMRFTRWVFGLSHS